MGSGALCLPSNEALAQLQSDAACRNLHSLALRQGLCRLLMHAHVGFSLILADPCLLKGFADCWQEWMLVMVRPLVLLRSLKQSTVLSTNFAVHPLIMMQ
jgi:hypothetical protein